MTYLPKVAPYDKTKPKHTTTSSFTSHELWSWLWSWHISLTTPKVTITYNWHWHLWHTYWQNNCNRKFMMRLTLTILTQPWVVYGATLVSWLNWRTWFQSADEMIKTNSKCFCLNQPPWLLFGEEGARLYHSKQLCMPLFLMEHILAPYLFHVAIYSK